MRLPTFFLTMAFAALWTCCALAAPLPDYVFCRIGFDGGAEGLLLGEPLKPLKAEKLQYAAGDVSQALVVGAGTVVRYDLGKEFPRQAGAFEIRFQPAFPQTADSVGRTVLALKGKAPFEAELSFHPKGVRWILTVKGRKWRKELTLWHGRVKQGQWNHVLFVWNKEERTFSIYHQGKWVQTIPHDNRFGGPAFLEIGSEQDAGIRIDEIALYSRAFTHDQAKLLAETFSPEVERFAALTAQLEKDDRALAARRALVLKLNGKVGRVSHNRGHAPSAIVYPEGIEGVAIKPEDIGKIDLSRFSVLHFPMGPKFQIEPAQYKYIVEFVRKGGGYVGCCQGAYFAEKLKLLDIKCYNMDVWGLYNIVLRPHFVTDNRKGVIRMHFGNGPIMLAGKDCQVLATYYLGFPPGEPAAILTGKCGKGTVVLFGTHPLGESVSYKGTKAYFSGKLLETDVMFVNALLYAAGIVAEPEAVDL